MIRIHSLPSHPESRERRDYTTQALTGQEHERVEGASALGTGRARSTGAGLCGKRASAGGAQSTSQVILGELGGASELLEGGRHRPKGRLVSHLRIWEGRASLSSPRHLPK